MHPTVLQEIVTQHIADLLADADRRRRIRQARRSIANRRRCIEGR
jgi:hypothetical protein